MYCAHVPSTVQITASAPLLNSLRFITHSASRCSHCPLVSCPPSQQSRLPSEILHWTPTRVRLISGDLVEINTNLVLFCFFKPAEDAPHQERCLILKFLHTRLLTQSEQFANELTRHLDICAPTCRILRQKVCMHTLLRVPSWLIMPKCSSLDYLQSLTTLLAAACC